MDVSGPARVADARLRGRRSTRRSRTRRRSTRAGSATRPGSSARRACTWRARRSGIRNSAPSWCTFDVTAAAPDAWHVISQGNGTSRGADGKARWDSGGAMDEIYLVGGPLHQFKDSAGAIETLVYLHERDASLAGKYLAATAQYLEMYRSLDRPVSVRQVRAGRELLGDRLRDADLHAARPAGHPVPVHHQLVVPARDPAQLVGQLGVRRLRHRELVRGADGLHGRSPDPGAARDGRRVPALDAAEVPRLRAGPAATSRSPSSASASARPPRPSATARR